MRTQLTNLVTRLALLLTLVIGWNSPKSWAFEATRSDDLRLLASHCLRGESTWSASQPTSQHSVKFDWKVDVALPLSVWQRFTQLSQECYENWYSPLRAAVARQDWNQLLSPKSPAKVSLLVAAPSAGRPPRPSERIQVLTRSSLSWNSMHTLEACRTYELSSRMWTFHRSKAPMGRLETSWPSDQYRVDPAGTRIGDWLTLVESWQCRLAAEMHSCESVARATESATRTARHWFESLAALLPATTNSFTPTEPAEELKPHFTKPLFVIYEFTGGQQFVISAQQAQEWSLIRPYEPEAKPVATDIAQRVCPFRQWLNDICSSQFERAQQLIRQSGNQLAGLIDDLTEVQVAAAPKPAVR